LLERFRERSPLLGGWHVPWSPWPRGCADKHALSARRDEAIESFHLSFERFHYTILFTLATSLLAPMPWS
jgi:hypothetical protein